MVKEYLIIKMSTTMKDYGWMELPKEMAPKNTINKTPIMLEILSKGKKMVSVHIHGIAEPVSI